MPEPTSRTESLPDGTVAAYYTENDEERCLGTFRDERTAKFELENALEAVKARQPAEPEPEPTKASTTTKKATS
jgi:hypothetical protein